MLIQVIDINNENEAKKQIKKVGCDPYAVKLLSSKAFINVIALENIDNRAANIIKQELLSAGADAVVNKVVGNFKQGKSKVLIMATPRQYERFLKKLSVQPFGLKDLSSKIKTALLNYNKNQFILSCGRYKININTTPKIMGIINVTPDSFSDGGNFLNADKAVEHGIKMAKAGADILDIGGESTRPGAKALSTKEEISRIVPVISKLAKYVKIPISVDTYKPETAKAAIEAGAVIVNDITGLRYKNGRMADVIFHYKLPVVIMHMQGRPDIMQKKPSYNDVVCDINNFFTTQIEYALNKGIDKNKIILDPGIGFGKTVEHNMEILKRLREFKVFGMPVLIGTSKKSFIGKITGDNLPEHRIEGSLISSFFSALNGANILRVHDVEETLKMIKMLKVIKEI